MPRKADADEIRKAYRKLARKYHPDLNPGDKSAEDRFKNVQEAYDILSDPKKRQMYDQFGFYSENGFAGAGRRGRQAAAARQHGFQRLRFLRFHVGGAGAPADGGGRQGTAAGGGFRDIFTQFFGGGGGQPEDAEPEKGGDLEYALNIDFWQAIRGTQARVNITRYDVCATCHGTGSTGAGEVTCPQCNGTGNVSQMAGAMKFNLTCPRCGGTGKLRNACPTCDGDGRVTRTETVEVRIPPGARDGSRLRVRRQGQCRHHGRASGRSLHHHPGGAASVLPPRWRRYRNQGAGRRLGGGAGRQDRGAHHRRPHAAQDSAGHQQRPEVPAAREGRAQLAHEPARRSDRGGRR